MTMHREDSPIALLFGGYFHQDWMIEGPDAGTVIRKFTEESEKEDVRRAKEEAEALLSADFDEARLARILNEMGLYYLPQADGMSYRDWLTFVVETLDSSLQ
jgi:hypothetical protein